MDINEYRITPASAVALCDNADESKRQDCLLIENDHNGETFEYVVFGFAMPKTEDDFKEICNWPMAWESVDDSHKLRRCGG